MCHVLHFTCHLCHQPRTLTLLTPPQCPVGWFSKTQNLLSLLRKNNQNPPKKVLLSCPALTVLVVDGVDKQFFYTHGHCGY